jgi:hypothetical protein
MTTFTSTRSVQIRKASSASRRPSFCPASKALAIDPAECVRLPGAVHGSRLTWNLGSRRPRPFLRWLDGSEPPKRPRFRPPPDRAWHGPES